MLIVGTQKMHSFYPSPSYPLGLTACETPVFENVKFHMREDVACSNSQILLTGVSLVICTVCENVFSRQCAGGVVVQLK